MASSSPRKTLSDPAAVFPQESSDRLLGKEGLERRYYLVAAPKTELVTLLQTLVMAGLRPKKVDSRPLALTRGVGAPSAFILNVETYGLDVIVVVEHVPLMVFQRQLQLGIGTEDLVDEILDEFQNGVEYNRERNPSAPISANAPVYLTGAHPQLNSGFTQILTTSLRRDLLLPEPPLTYPEDFPVSQYMVNVGLALKRM